LQILLSETNVPVNFKQKINIKTVANFKWTVYTKDISPPKNEVSLQKV